MTLDHPVHLTGKVVKGFHLSDGFGIATANLDVVHRDEHLSDGVYFVEVRSKSRPELGKMAGLLHIGDRKTFGGEFSVEVHLLHFEGDLYDDVLMVDVLKRRRNIIKFKNADELYSQIEKDIIWAKKFFVRRSIFARWEQVNDFQRLKMGRLAIEHIEKMPRFLEANRVFVFAPTRNEINFVQIICSKFKKKEFCFPKVDKQIMQFYPATFENLKPGKFGILAPVGGRPARPTAEDIIFVPALAVDAQKNRLGRGGGYFDRFLENNPAYKFCMVPDFAKVDEVPVEDHDVPVDEVLFVSSEV